jgi:hypothetical protein
MAFLVLTHSCQRRDGPAMNESRAKARHYITSKRRLQMIAAKGARCDIPANLRYPRFK